MENQGKNTKTIYLATISYKDNPSELHDKVFKTTSEVEEKAEYYKRTNSPFRVTGYIPVTVTY